ncbi:MAG TPA: M48 family metallopeptidase [Longimicrobiaceae bacterium]|nr:M48 family metallopeptidase [Longimicrobiaceae bacterium]
MSRAGSPAHPRARRSPTARARLAGWARLCALVLTLGLAGCISEDREQELGDRIAAQINAQLPLVRDPALHLYVNRLGGLIARKSDRPDVPYRFYIVDSPGVNAFALPGGHIYVNRGLIERTSDVSELSAVLAHEIGHVAARHGAQSLERQLRTGSLISVLYRVILGGEPELLDQTALRLGHTLWTASHSRQAELQADELAVRYLIEAGVDPRGIITFLKGLLREEAATERRTLSLEWFSTHPMTEERIRQTQEEIGEELPEASPGLARDIASYPAFLRRVRALPPPPIPHPVPHP